VFALNIPVTFAGIEAIKADLTRALPEVKSSHRCEAIARGLGFRTYAALLAASRLPVPVFATAQGAAFSAYLADHRFDTRSLPFYRAVALHRDSRGS
jgi:hypothetical protein